MIESTGVQDRQWCDLWSSLSWRLLAPLLCLPLLNCAGTATVRECNAMLERNQLDRDLPRLQQMVRQAPEAAECRQALTLGTERLVVARLRDAERARQEGRSEQAGQLYRQVLELQPANDAARQGLSQLERQQQVRDMLQESAQAIQSRDWAVARRLVEAALRVEPGQPQAMSMQQEIARQSAPAPAEAGLMAAFKKPITIEFKEVALRQVFEMLARGSGLNFVFDKDVKVDQKTSIFLRDSTVESALYFLLLTNQLEHQIMNANTVLVFPNAPGKLKDYQELSVRIFQMANTDVKSVAAALKTLFKGRDMVVDEKQNMLVVRDTPDAIRLVEKLVALHDVAEPEVMLEVAVLEVSRKKLLDLGISLPNSLSLTPLASNAAAGLTLNDLRGINSSAIGATLGGSVTLNLQQANTDVNILANPRIRVVNREKARVLIGERVPVITVTTSPTGGFAESINYVEVGLKLDVEPTIYRGNDIVIKVGMEVSNISGTTKSKLGGEAYTFGTRTANTTLRLRDGENQILAGLINDEERKVASKVPGVSELPVVGRIFGSSRDEGTKTEIMLSITPRLVRNSRSAESSIVEFRSGTENNLRERPSIVGRVQVPVPEGQGAPAVASVAPTPAAAPSPAPAAIPVASPAVPAPLPSPVPPSSPDAKAPPAVVGMPVVKINQGAFVSPGASLAGKATGTRVDDGSDAK